MASGIYRAVTISMALLISLSGCSSHLISSARPDGHCLAGQPCKITQTSIAGRQGASTDGGTGYVTGEECGDEALRRVEVRRNFGQGIVSLLTLGIVNPATIYFTCAKPEVPSGEDGPDDEF